MLENVFDTLDQTLNPPLQYETVERMMSLRLPLVLLLSFFFALHAIFLFWMRRK